MIKEGIPYTIAAYGNSFWNQYSDVFEGIDVVGEAFKDGVDESQLIPITRNDVSVSIIPAMSRPSELFTESIRTCDCVLIKIISRKANLAIELAKKYNKPYMIGITGDLYGYLKNTNSIIKKVYARVLYTQSLKAIKDCKFGTYVTQEYLQQIYPISGKMCGFADVNIPYIDVRILEKRKKKIKAMTFASNINIGIVGAYHTANKGHDTIIKALGKLDNKQMYLRVLGTGIKEDQDKWIEYGKFHNYSNIIFDKPVSGIEKVFEWIDNLDICVLPSRSEGLPRSIIEAISRGCPCITSNVCGLPELINKRWQHNPEDVEKLSKLIIEMIDNPELMETTAVENCEHSKNYEINYITQKRNDFFLEFKKYAIQKNKSGL